MIRTANLWLGTEARTLGERFLAWWLGELRTLVPERAKAALIPSPRRLVVELGPVVVFKLSSEGVEQTIAHCVGTDRTGLAAALAGHATAKTDILVRLPPEKVLVRRLDLPLTRDRDLCKLLAFELERQTPLAAAEVDYDARIVARDRQYHRMTVEVALAHRKTVDEAAAEIAGWGGQITAIGAPHNPASDWAPTLRAAPQDGIRRARLLVLGLACLSIVLAASLVTLEGMRTASIGAALKSELLDVKAAAEVAATAQAKAKALAAQRRFLPDLRRTGSLAAAFDTLARILPDDTFLTEAHLDGDQIRIGGISTAADRLIETIDLAPGFTDAHFTAPLVRQLNSGADRFDITLTRRSPQ